MLQDDLNTLGYNMANEIQYQQVLHLSNYQGTTQPHMSNKLLKVVNLILDQ